MLIAASTCRRASGAGVNGPGRDPRATLPAGARARPRGADMLEAAAAQYRAQVLLVALSSLHLWGDGRRRALPHALPVAHLGAEGAGVSERRGRGGTPGHGVTPGGRTSGGVTPGEGAHGGHTGGSHREGGHSGRKAVRSLHVPCKAQDEELIGGSCWGRLVGFRGKEGLPKSQFRGNCEGLVSQPVGRRPGAAVPRAPQVPS